MGMRRVALCTDSVAVSSIGASLEHLTGVEVLRIDLRSKDAARRLDHLCPDVAIIDLCALRPESIALLRRFPDLLLIGVDLARDELVVLSGTPACPLTMGNLVQVIETGCVIGGRKKLE